MSQKTAAPKPKSPLEIVNHPEEKVSSIDTPSQNEEVQPETQKQKRSLLKPMSTAKPKSPLKKIATSLFVVIAGLSTGFGLSRAIKPPGVSSTPTKTEEQIAAEGVKVGDIIGSPDLEHFSDPAEGVVQVGGIDGEGSHRLLREGGPARNVYLTSTVIDLNLLVGHRVKVWGDTYAAQKAGWLMDVGRAEVLELNAPLPFDPDAQAQP